MLEKPPQDVLDALAHSTSLAQAITTLRKWAGSHDKLADRLGGTSRQRVIEWEKGAVPRDYRDQLIELGVPARLFGTVSRAELEQRLTKTERELQEIRRLLEVVSP